MKKLLSVLLILVLCSISSAVMNLQISVGGNTSITEITIAPSDYLVLDITNLGDFTQPANAGYFGLVCDPAHGDVVMYSGVVTGLAPSASSLDKDPANQADLAAMYGNPGVYGTVASWTAGNFAGGKYFDEISFHCVAPIDAVVQLIWTPDFVTYTVIDSLTVHQVIPEPATIALLCLGGLLLRKRS